MNIVLRASRVLSQTDREALAVVWASMARELHVQLLLTIGCNLGSGKKASVLHISRWALLLQPYVMTLKYKADKDDLADYMSRHPLPKIIYAPDEQKIAEEYMNFVINT